MRFLNALAVFGLFCVLILLGIFLIIAIINIIRFWKSLSIIVSNNETNINKTIELVPEILENANDVVLCAKDSVNKASETISCVGRNIALGGWRSWSYHNKYHKHEGVLNSIRSIGEVLKMILEFLHDCTEAKE